MAGISRQRSAWLILAVGIAAYLLAVVHRTSLGVAGVEAIDRFGIGAATLSLLPVLQVAVYAGLQVPAGFLIDRFGARSVIVAGSVVMASGQALLAFTGHLELALAARILIGAGDAPIFVAANRLIADNFPPRRVPLLTQVLGTAGQLGQIVTAVAVAWQLHTQGWTPAFASLAVVGLAIAILAWAGIGPRAGAAHGSVRQAPSATMWEAARHPGVQLGFWTHWTGLFAPSTIALLWGVPFLVSAQGLNAQTASSLLVVMVVANMVAAPIIGALTGRFPMRRSTLALASAAIIAAAWVALLAWPTPRPMWQLILFMTVMGLGTPASLIGLDFARTFSPQGRLSVSTAVANMGGFVGTIAGVALVGITLEVVTEPGVTEYSLSDYRVAFATLALPWAMGVTGILVNRRKARRVLEDEGVVIRPLATALIEAWRGRASR